MNRTSTANSPCAVCGYPVPAPTTAGETARCPYCGTINQAIGDVATSSAWLIGIVCFIGGIILGPSVTAAIEVGSQRLGSKTRERFK